MEHAAIRQGKFDGKVVSAKWEDGVTGPSDSLVTFLIPREQAAELFKLPSGSWLTCQWGPLEAKAKTAA